MSNLGFHIDANFEYGDAYWRISQLKGRLAAITAILNPNDLLKAAPAINAATNQALRFHNVEMNMSGTDQGQFTAQQNVDTVLNAIAPALPLYPKARWAYFRNEIGDFSKADFYNLEMKLWIEGLAKRGYFGGICCWSFGTPDYALWPKFDGALAAANANGGAVLYHEYGVQTMKSLYDPVKKTGHHCLRYRNVWSQNNYPARFPNLMWWVTETGLDKDVNTGQGGGWKEVGISPTQYLNDNLFWYDNEISKDGVSATVYQWGTDPVWAPYDVQGPVVDGMIARISTTVPQLKLTQTVPPNPVPPVDPPPPPPPPAPTGWQRVALTNDGFEGATYIEPEDIFGSRRIPVGWNLDWKTTQLPPHAEIELHPSHVAEGRQSARVYSDGLWEFWHWRTIKVPSHGTVRLKARSLATATDVVDGPSRPADKLQRWIGIDASGGTAESDRTPPEAATLKWTEAITGKDLYEQQIVETQALGDTVTILLRARHTGSTLRADVFWDDVVVEVLPLDGQSPPPLTFPFRVAVNTTASYIYMRSEPNSASEANKIGQVYVGKPVWVDGVSEDGKWWKLRGQDVYISRQLTKVI